MSNIQIAEAIRAAEWHRRQLDSGVPMSWPERVETQQSVIDWQGVAIYEQERDIARLRAARDRRSWWRDAVLKLRSRVHAFLHPMIG